MVGEKPSGSERGNPYRHKVICAREDVSRLKRGRVNRDEDRRQQHRPQQSQRYVEEEHDGRSGQGKQGNIVEPEAQEKHRAHEDPQRSPDPARENNADCVKDRERETEKRGRQQEEDAELSRVINASYVAALFGLASEHSALAWKMEGEL